MGTPWRKCTRLIAIPSLAAAVWGGDGISHDKSRATTHLLGNVGVVVVGSCHMCCLKEVGPWHCTDKHKVAGLIRG